MLMTSVLMMLQNLSLEMFWTLPETKVTTEQNENLVFPWRVPSSVWQRAFPPQPSIALQQNATHLQMNDSFGSQCCSIKEQSKLRWCICLLSGLFWSALCSLVSKHKKCHELTLCAILTFSSAVWIKTGQLFASRFPRNKVQKKRFNLTLSQVLLHTTNLKFPKCAHLPCLGLNSALSMLSLWLTPSCIVAHQMTKKSFHSHNTSSKNQNEDCLRCLLATFCTTSLFELSLIRRKRGTQSQQLENRFDAGLKSTIVSNIFFEVVGVEVWKMSHQLWLPQWKKQQIDCDKHNLETLFFVLWMSCFNVAMLITKSIVWFTKKNPQIAKKKVAEQFFTLISNQRMNVLRHSVSFLNLSAMIQMEHSVAKSKSNWTQKMTMLLMASRWLWAFKMNIVKNVPCSHASLNLCQFGLNCSEHEHKSTIPMVTST